MKKIGTLTLAAMLFSSVSLAEPNCDKACKSTWTQWVGDAAVMFLAYEGLSARVPALQAANAWMITKVTEYTPVAVAFIQSKFGKPAEKKDN